MELDKRERVGGGVRVRVCACVFVRACVCLLCLCDLILHFNCRVSGEMALSVATAMMLYWLD